MPDALHIPPGSPLTLIPPCHLAPRLGRHILLANDPRLDTGVLATLDLGPLDAVVQFNRAESFEHLQAVACRKIHVFQGNGNGSNFGFDAGGAPLRDWLDQAASELLLIYTFWKANAVRSAWTPPPERAVEQVVSPKRHVAAWRYPEQRIPSAGFIVLSYLRQVNVARYLLGLPVFPIVTLGFTGSYPKGLGWSGHDFAHEQAALRTWLDVERLDLAGQPQVPPPQ